MVAIHGRRCEGRLVENTGKQSFHKVRVFTAIAIGVLLGSMLAFLFHSTIFSFNTPSIAVLNRSQTQVSSAASCESSEQMKKLKSEIVTLEEKNSYLERELRVMTQKLRLAEQKRDNAEKNTFVLARQLKTRPSGTLKAPLINPTVVADESVNPRLAKLLEEVAINKELIVALANSHVTGELEIWSSNIKRVGITNYLVVALDEEIIKFCESNKIHFYKRYPDEIIDDIGRNGGNHDVSGLKYCILREFLQLGYSVLLSDIDIVYLQNPFDHLYRDSDIEAMSDGHDDSTAYGYDEVFDDPEMGWSRSAHTIRIWVYNSGFFYIRPTMPAIELLDRVASRLSSQKESWDQQVFNEELFFPSYPNYEGLHASRRTMDRYLFMNSKFLFKTVRHDFDLSKLTPVLVHLSYHPDKLSRMQAIVDYYINGKEDAFKALPLAYPYPSPSDE